MSDRQVCLARRADDVRFVRPRLLLNHHTGQRNSRYFSFAILLLRASQLRRTLTRPGVDGRILSLISSRWTPVPESLSTYYQEQPLTTLPRTERTEDARTKNFHRRTSGAPREAGVRLGSESRYSMRFLGRGPSWLNSSLPILHTWNGREWKSRGRERKQGSHGGKQQDASVYMKIRVG